MFTIKSLHSKALVLDLTDVFVVISKLTSTRRLRAGELHAPFAAPVSPQQTGPFSPNQHINADYSVYSSEVAFNNNAAAIFSGSVSLDNVPGLDIPADLNEQLKAAIVEQNKK